MEGIEYLNKALQNYKQFDVEAYINLSYLAEVEAEKDNPELVIWCDNFDNRINITSKIEYNSGIKIIKKRCKKYGLNLEANLPTVLFEVEGQDKVNNVLRSILTYKKYDKKMEDLIEALSDSPKLELK